MPNVPETQPVSNTLQTWLSQGEQLYAAAMNEFHSLEAQLEELEKKLQAKQTEVNQIASIINKPPVESSHRGMMQLSPPPMLMDEHERLPIPGAAAMNASHTSNSNATIARALTGKFGR